MRAPMRLLSAPDEDYLGLILVLNNHLTDADVTFVTRNDGIVETLAEYYDLIDGYKD
jgi:hypothetical protein